jgi:zeaxanthin glucosyltransferase
MRIGFVSMPLSGHLNPMTTLARKLVARGNEVVFIGVPDAGPIVRAANLDFVPFCEKEYPLGWGTQGFQSVAKLHGLDVVKHTLAELSPGLLKAGLQHLPEVLERTGVEALVLDTIYFFLELAPMRLGMPYVHIWNVLHLDFSATTPSALFSGVHEETEEARARNRKALEMTGQMLAPLVAVAKPYAEEAGLRIDWNNPAATTSKLAVISQTPKEFDFPGVPSPPQFHYAGPFHDDQGREPVSFPWERLTCKPLIYASLGTLVNGLVQVYRTILDAVRTLPELQLVLSVGRNINPADLGPVPSNTIVVNAAPQIELLKSAVLCITHAGLNTTLESLAQGVPMVAIPIGYEQPGVASRTAYHGAGELIEVDDLTVERLAGLIQQVMGNSSYRRKARYFQTVIAQTRGLEVAATVIEQAFGINQPTDLAGKTSELSYA